MWYRHPLPLASQDHAQIFGPVILIQKRFGYVKPICWQMMLAIGLQRSKAMDFAMHYYSAGQNSDLIMAKYTCKSIKKYAPEMRRFCRKNGRLILSGILNWQERSLCNIYRQHGFTWQKSYHDGQWVTLVLQKR